MAKNPKRPRDINQLAKSIVDIAVGDDVDIDIDAKKAKAGKKGAKARSRSLSPAQRSDIASIAAQARWKKSN